MEAVELLIIVVMAELRLIRRILKLLDIHGHVNEIMERVLIVLSVRVDIMRMVVCVIRMRYVEVLIEEHVRVLQVVLCCVVCELNLHE